MKKGSREKILKWLNSLAIVAGVIAIIILGYGIVKTLT